MKRICALLLILTLAVGLAGCGGKKLSGSYSCFYRYDFTITKDGRGDYGGKCVRYAGGEPYGEYSWYVEDNIVFLDGKAMFGYYPEKDYIYELDSLFDVTLNEDMTCVTNEETFSIFDKRVIAGTEGRYVNEDGILYFYWGDDIKLMDLVISNSDCLLVDGKAYFIYGGPN